MFASQTHACQSNCWKPDSYQIWAIGLVAQSFLFERERESTKGAGEGEAEPIISKEPIAGLNPRDLGL